MNDPTASSRKKDHIDLAFTSQQEKDKIDGRFYYEPIMSGHPREDKDIGIDFLGYRLDTPIWVSSMTGGTEMASQINKNLAKACGEFGMGMGLGSCRSLLYSRDRFDDFDVKSYMPNQPLYANLGIAQMAEMAAENHWVKVKDLLSDLTVDGLIIHINPMQEWLQPEGDIYHEVPLDIIKLAIDHLPDTPIIVKEVGQGMGIASLRALYQLPIAAVDFGAAGGTNFSLLELARYADNDNSALSLFANVGHTADEMVSYANEILNLDDVPCQHTIISGGVKDFMDGYYLTQRLHHRSVYAQASAFLRPAMQSYEALQEYIIQQRQGLVMAHSFLKLKA